MPLIELVVILWGVRSLSIADKAAQQIELVCSSELPVVLYKEQIEKKWYDYQPTILAVDGFLLYF
jgi:hypothetical protein